MLAEKDTPLLKDSADNQSVARRLVVVLSAILGCLTNAGLAFGFSALKPELISNGAFHDLCKAGQSGACRSQFLALNGMFTVATSMLNIMALPCGYVLDSKGPRITAAACAVGVAAGCFVFAYGGPGVYGHLCYYFGFLLLAIAGPAIFNCTLSFGNLFPGREGLVTASLVGCFDASSVIFVLLAAVMRSGFSFCDTFMGYAAVPLVIAVVAATMWPKKPVVAKAVSADGGADIKLAPYEGRSLQGQICSAVFVWFAYLFCITMVCINYFIATCLEQMTEVNPETALRLTHVFSALLPLGGIVFIPVIGKLVDEWGAVYGYVVLWGSFILFHALLALYSITSNEAFAIGAFVVFAFCRPLFYTLGASFVGQIFGFQTFGKLYGLLNLIAGCANFLVTPLGVLAASHGFGLTIALLTVFQVTTVGLPVYVLKSKKGTMSRPPSRRHSFASPFVERMGDPSAVVALT